MNRKNGEKNTNTESTQQPLPVMDGLLCQSLLQQKQSMSVFVVSVLPPLVQHVTVPLYLQGTNILVNRSCKHYTSMCAHARVAPAIEAVPSLESPDRILFKNNLYYVYFMSNKTSSFLPSYKLKYIHKIMSIIGRYCI